MMTRPYHILSEWVQILTHIFIRNSKEISMEPHPSQQALQQLKHSLLQHGQPLAQLRLLALLHVQLTPLLHQNTAQQQQLVRQNMELKHLAQRLRKNNSQLNRQKEQCQELKAELRHVQGILTQKVQQLSQYPRHQEVRSPSHQQSTCSTRKEVLRNTDSQCQILSHTVSQQTSTHNAILKDKLHQAQLQLVQERHLNRDLTLRLEVLNVMGEADGPDQFKDTSTIDADSLTGDPFEQEDPEEVHLGQVSEPEEGHPFEVSWLGKLWKSTRQTYQSMLFRP